MKKEFVTPEVELQHFSVEDILTTSGGNPDCSSETPLD